MLCRILPGLAIVRRHSNRLVTFALAAPMQTCESSLSKRLWYKCKREAYSALYHPFIVALAAGTLELKAFQRFIVQDAFFLSAFAQSYGMASENVDVGETKSILKTLQKDVYRELELHDSFAKAWGVDLTKENQPAQATVAYTSFLLATAGGKIEGYDKFENGTGQKRSLAAFTVGAMTPCMRLYAFLGQQISTLVDVGTNNPYYQWISTYASKDFEESACKLELLLNSLGSTLTKEEHDIMAMLYHHAMTLEIDFFDAQKDYVHCYAPLFKSNLVKAHKFFIISDFDSTCTVSDSCPVLADLSINSALKEGKEHEMEANEAKAKMQHKWDVLMKDYTRSYTQLLDAILNGQDDTSATYRSCTEDSIRKVLEEVSHFEKQSNSKVVDSHALEGIHMNEIKKAGSSILLQEGCVSFFKRSLGMTSAIAMEVHILSVCWSRTFIQSTLSHAGIINDIKVHSNELGFNGDVSDGTLIREVETPLDKERFIRYILEEYKSKASKDELEPYIVYIGDSVTDLLCLLEANLGIVIGNNQTLQKFVSAFSLKIIPLYSVVTSNANKEGNQLLMASGWHEIEAFLLGRC